MKLKSLQDEHVWSLHMLLLSREGKGLDFKFFRGLNSAQEPATLEEIQLTCALMHLEDFKSILRINVLIGN